MVGSISTLGIGSGMKLQDIIDQLREVDQAVIDRKKTEVTDLESQLEEFTTIKNKLLDMKSLALDLSLEGTYISRSVTSSNEDAISATVTDGATVQSMSVTVDRLAGKSTWESTSGMAAADSVVTAVEISIGYTMGSTAITLTIPAGTTLSGLVDLINDDPDNPGITASVIDKGSGATPFHLVLQADNTGESSRISALSGLVMTEMQGAVAGSLNSQMNVGGITYYRQNNTISDVLAGVTLNLKGIGTSTVAAAKNDDSLTEKIKGLVTAYNDVVSEIRSKSAYDEATEEFGILTGTTVPDLVFDLQTLMTTTINADPDGEVTSFFDLGMEFNRDGTITIDEDLLAQAITDNPEGVEAFFLGDEDQEIVGFADTINDRLRTLTIGSGQLDAETTVVETRITDLESLIEKETERLDKKYELLTQQFIELDRYMKQMTTMSDYLTGQFAALSGNDTNQ